MVIPEASVSMANDRDKLGKSKTRPVVKVYFNFVKVS